MVAQLFDNDFVDELFDGEAAEGAVNRHPLADQIIADIAGDIPRQPADQLAKVIG